MAFFSRARPDDDAATALRLPDALPGINQRVSLITAGSEEPIPSRVDDEHEGSIVLASPNVPLERGEMIVLTWESERGWFALESSIQDVEEDALRPTITVSKHGRLTRYGNRRSDARAELALSLELRVVNARAIRAGRSLRTTTVSVGAQAISFGTSAPFAPGDIFEARLHLGAGDIVSARMKVIRIDRISGSWKQTCTAVFEEVLASDVARIVAHVDAVGG